MPNALSHLTEALFAQIDRLNDPTLTAEQIETEAKRATAMVGVADQINTTAQIQVTAAKLYALHGHQVLEHLPVVGTRADAARLSASPPDNPTASHSKAKP